MGGNQSKLLATDNAYAIIRLMKANYMPVEVRL